MNPIWTLFYILYDPARNLAAWSEYQKMRDSQNWSREKIEAMQLDKLRHLVAQARKNVPYYSPQRPGAAGSVRIEKLSDLAKFPVLRKDDIRKHGADMLSRSPGRNVSHARTGGSTGEPLRVARGVESAIIMEAAILRGREWAGVHVGDCGASLKGHGRVSMTGTLRRKLINLRPFLSYATPQELKRDVIPFFRQYRPKYLMGYPTSLLQFAEAASECPMEIPVIFTTGEMLYPQQKAQLESQFKAKVSDYYGCNEVSSMAFQCEHGQRHVTEEHVILETVDEDGNPVMNKPGRILLTDLDNHAMPFIRYEVGDMGVLTEEKCSCGKGLRVLKSLEGRMQDALRSRDGRALPGVFFAGRFRELKSIRAYQVAQKDWTNVEIRYVPDGSGAEAEIAEMSKVIRDNLGADVEVKILRVEKLELTRSGKSRLVIGMPDNRPASTAPAAAAR